MTKLKDEINMDPDLKAFPELKKTQACNKYNVIQ